MPPKKKASVEARAASQAAMPKDSSVHTTHNGTADAQSPDADQHHHRHQLATSTDVTTSGQAPSTASDSVDNIRAFYQTGQFVHPPRTYKDLLRVYVEFCVLCVPSSTATVSTALMTAPNGTAMALEKGTPQPPPSPQARPTTADLESQVRALLFVAVPHRVATYFEEIQLSTEASTNESGATRAAAATAVATETEGKASLARKRTRGLMSEAGDAHPVSEKTTDSTVRFFSSEVMQDRLLAYGAEHLRGFDSDSAYLAAKDMLVYVKYYAYLVAGMGLSGSLLKSIELAGLDFRRQCVPCVEAVMQLVHAWTEVQLRKMPLPPRVVRLSTRLQLSAKAAKTLEYLLVCHCGRYTPGAIAEPLRPANIAYHNDLTPQELLSILSESGVLWKQGLAFSDIKMRVSFMECKYALPLETIAALSGDQLSEEQLIKLERTTLSEVLSEERQTNTTRSLSPSRAATQLDGVPTVNEGRGKPLHRNAKGGPSEGGASRNPSRAASRSPLPKHRNDGAEVSDADNDNDEDETGSAAESTLTMTEDALEDALDHIDPQVLASGDASAIQEAVAQHLATTSKGEKKSKGTAAAEQAMATADTRGESGVEGSAPSPHSHAPAAPALADGVDAPPTAAAAADAATLTTTTTTTAATAESPRKPQLTLAEINPLAQRYRHGVDSAHPASSPAAVSSLTDSAMRDKPYDSDIEYMDAAFRILANIIRIRYAEGDMKDEEDNFTPKNKVEASLRELKGKVRVAAAVHESRLQATLAANTFTPQIEQLARRLHLTEMEKQIMLFMVGNVISHDMLVAVNGRYVMRDGQRLITVGYILFVLCETLEERVVARRAFYQSAPLIANGVLSLSFETTGRSCFNTDLMDYLVDIDRKIVDDVMGIDAETAEMVPGSQLYFPSVELENVVLPTSTMDRVLSTIEHYSLFEQCKKRSGFGEGLGTSKGGLVMLFFGPSGTGKTMLANAVAHHLKKKILLVSIAQFRSSTKAESDALKFLFREAKLSDAIIFFDECESLFEDRQSNTTVTALLSEFERYDGLVILATNKAQNFDEAMNRRISLMMEFRPPDHQLRLRIWKSHIPKQLCLGEDVSLEKLALNYELSGGLIRNAVLAALSRAVAREKSAAPTLMMTDLDEGARLQLRGFFLAAERPEGMSEFYVTPKRTLAELVLEPALAHKLEMVASVAKSRSTLYTQWGFSEDANDDCGALYLFQGVSGTGKSLAAEGIAYECGATIRLCNVAELLLREEMRVHAVFEEGRRLGAIIIFDEAQVLFNESPKSLQLSQLIQYHSRRYPRPIIVIATTTSRDGGGGRQLFSTTSINSRSSCMLFQAEITFLLPNRQLREQLWRRAFPERVPVAADVDYAKLSGATISPKLIRTVAFSVCCQAALLPVAARTITMAMIEKEVEKALVRERSSVSASAMFA